MTETTKKGDSALPWWKRSRREWALRDAGHSPARILMSRWADEQGLNSDGTPSLWSDVGRIDSYSDAEAMLSLLNGAADVDALLSKLQDGEGVLRERIRLLEGLLLAVHPDEMGGYPDLFAPIGGWDDWARRVTEALR